MNRRLALESLQPTTSTSKPVAYFALLVSTGLHAKRVLSLANATLGVLTSASLAIHAVGRGLAQAMGTQARWIGS